MQIHVRRLRRWLLYGAAAIVALVLGLYSIARWKVHNATTRLNSKLGVDVPVVPGIMPITNYTQLMRFSDMCGAEIPRWIRLKLASFGDDSASIKAFGVDVVAGLCERLVAGGAPGLHFYSMNQAAATTAIWQRLQSAA